MCPRCGTPAGDAVWCSGCGLNLRQQGELPTADLYSAGIRERDWLARQESEREAKLSQRENARTAAEATLARKAHEETTEQRQPLADKKAPAVAARAAGKRARVPRTWKTRSIAALTLLLVVAGAAWYLMTDGEVKSSSDSNSEPADRDSGLDHVYLERRGDLEKSLQRELAKKLREGSASAITALEDEGLPASPQDTRVSRPNCQEGEIQDPDLPRGKWECDTRFKIQSEANPEPYEPSFIFHVDFADSEACWEARETEAAYTPEGGFRPTSQDAAITVEGCIPGAAPTPRAEHRDGCPAPAPSGAAGHPSISIDEEKGLRSTGIDCGGAQSLARNWARECEEEWFSDAPCYVAPDGAADWGCITEVVGPPGSGGYSRVTCTLVERRLVFFAFTVS